MSLISKFSLVSALYMKYKQQIQPHIQHFYIAHFHVNTNKISVKWKCYMEYLRL